jgi:hypothetical protein
MSVESESCMTSTNKKYRMCISGPGNVTVIQVRPRKVLWASNTKIRRSSEFPAKLWLDDDNVLSGGQCCTTPGVTGGKVYAGNHSTMTIM